MLWTICVLSPQGRQMGRGKHMTVFNTGVPQPVVTQRFTACVLSGTDWTALLFLSSSNLSGTL
jgi:hypothetical protein